MNVAVRKRHEQLERWRQNEASIEQSTRLAQQQQTEQQTQQPQVSKPMIRRVNSSSCNSAASDELLQANASKQEDDESVNDENSAPQSNSQKHARKHTAQLLSKQAKLNSQSTEDSCAEDDLRATGACCQQPPGKPQKRPQSRNSNSPNNQLNFSPKSRSPAKQRNVRFDEDTLFKNACASGDLDECRRLLASQCVDVDAASHDGLTGLHEAVIYGRREVVAFLLDEGANANCADNEGWTPLHAAASLNQPEMVALLLERGADATLVNNENLLAVDLTRSLPVKALLDERLSQFDVDELRSREQTFIERDIERWLATGQYDEQRVGPASATVLHVIAAKGYAQCARKLLSSRKLRAQLDLEARDADGFTPLLAASYWQQQEVLELLIEAGADISARANNGYSIASSVSIVGYFFACSCLCDLRNSALF